MQDSYLFPTLEAGASRVFNIGWHSAALARSAPANGRTRPQADGAGDLLERIQADADVPADQWCFRNSFLNCVVVVKEARPQPSANPFAVDRPVGTKLYFPFNMANIYEGGRSIFVDDPRLEDVLADHAGLNDTERDEDAARDLRLIYALDDIPSLDPFLLKDKMQIEKIAVNDSYFMIPDDEWKAIREDIRRKLKPIVDSVFPNSKGVEDNRTSILINKLWNTKDVRSLMPIVEAFGLPKEDASSIFAAWKGIMYYDVEYNKNKDNWDQCLNWLSSATKPIDYVESHQVAALNGLRNDVVSRYMGVLADLEMIFGQYYDAYDQLFVQRNSPKPFVDYMRNGIKTYWKLGSRMSAINHSVAVWEMLTADAFGRLLRFEPLFTLLDIQRGILESARDNG